MRGLSGKSWCPNFFMKHIDNLSTFKTYKLVFYAATLQRFKFSLFKKASYVWFRSNDRCWSVRNTRLHIRLRYGQSSIKCYSYPSLIIHKPLSFFYLFVAKKANHIILVTNIYKKCNMFTNPHFMLLCIKYCYLSKSEYEVWQKMFTYRFAKMFTSRFAPLSLIDTSFLSSAFQLIW